MAEPNLEDEHPATADSPSPPQEPFPHLTNHPSWGIRSPTFFALFFTGVALCGLWVIYSGATEYARSGDGAALFMAIAAVLLVAGGAINTYMGVRRWQWKREYERVMGRSPW